jgi:hypothetical protein
MKFIKQVIPRRIEPTTRVSKESINVRENLRNKYNEIQNIRI